MLAKASVSPIMEMLLSVFLLAFTSRMTLMEAQEPKITSPPQPVNIALNRAAEFNCTFIGDILIWEANRTQIVNDVMGYMINTRTQPTRMSTLTAFASLDKNNTNITCVAISAATLMGLKSEPVVLRIQGLLESVSNLTMTSINSTTVLISWSPPFTLEGVSILGYNVTITNTTSGENETMLVKNTILLYSIDHPDPESNFTVTVVPINEVGAGQPANLKFTTLLTFQPYKIKSSSSSSYITELFTSTIGSVRTSHIMHVPRTSTTVITGPARESMMLVSTLTSSIVIASDSSVVVPALIAVNVVTMITVLSILAIILTCYLIKKYKIRVPKAPLHDVVPVKDNPAYQLVILNEQPASVPSAAQQPTPVSHQYENVLEVYKEYEGGNNEDDYENAE